jgi:hypothetical protein
VSLTHIVPISLYLSIGMHASIVVGIVGNPSVISFHILSLLLGLGRILVILHHAYPPLISCWNSIAHHFLSALTLL